LDNNSSDHRGLKAPNTTERAMDKLYDAKVKGPGKGEILSNNSHNRINMTNITSHVYAHAYAYIFPLYMPKLPDNEAEEVLDRISDENTNEEGEVSSMTVKTSYEFAIVGTQDRD